MRSRRLFCTIWIVLAASFGASLAHAFNDDELANFGDVMQLALPAIGLGATWLYDDSEGAKQWFWSGLTSVGTTTVLKGVYGKVRPNASTSATSFPSGHTTAAFWGASFLDMRYGKWWGIPAYTAATITAYSRVISDNHHVDDTLMGGSIAVLSSLYWVTPHENAVSLVPFQSGDAVGISLNFKEGAKPDSFSGLGDRNRWRYSIVFGPAWQQKNQVTSPIATGTQFDLNNFRETNDPTTTASAVIDWIHDRHLLTFAVSPFEARDFGEFSQATTFGNTVYLPGEEIRSAFRLIDARLQYNYDFLPGSKVILLAGAGIGFQHTTVTIDTTDGVKSERASSDTWMPLVNASLGYAFDPRWSLIAELGGLSVSDQKQLDANVSLGYRLNKYWETAAGVGFFEHDIESGDLKNTVDYNIFMLSVGYSFY